MRFTYEKITEEEVDQWISGSGKKEKIPDLILVLQEEFNAGIVSLEKGKNGQEHFQCTVRCKSRKRRSAVRKWLLTHYDDLEFPEKDYCEPCRKMWASIQYCKKEETHIAGPWTWGMDDELDMTLKETDLPPPRPFQAKILEELSVDAPIFNTKILWYVDYSGQIGKTMLGKMLVLKLKFYMLDGSAEKMKFQAAKHPAKGYILNIPRSKEGHFSYNGLEAVSDGFFCDTFGSEQQGMQCRKGSHLICFANWMPDTEKVTKSRWIIHEWDTENEEFVKIDV